LLFFSVRFELVKARSLKNKVCFQAKKQKNDGVLFDGGGEALAKLLRRQVLMNLFNGGSVTKGVAVQLLF
jgi:hypothetical protein